jgi:NADH:ubiquinone oxidoreductase subunit F (NADH-binding)
LRSVAEGRQRPVVVVNGTEGEPNSGKDSLLLTSLPHLVLDGALWAAAAVGADRVVIGIDRTRPEALVSMNDALAERVDSEPSDVEVRITDTPPRYVAGEESALVHWINGGPAKPTATPPRPYQRGVDGRPTLVQNTETLAHLAQICAYGADWFRQAGPPEEPGTALMTVSGAVGRPSVVEAPIGTPIGEILDLAGGPTAPLQALLVGGFFGTWVAASEALSAPFSRAGLQPLGASPGAGIIIALPAGACGLGAIPPELVTKARWAVANCPTLALHLETGERV